MAYLSKLYDLLIESPTTFSKYSRNNAIIFSASLGFTAVILMILSILEITKSNGDTASYAGSDSSAADSKSIARGKQYLIISGSMLMTSIALFLHSFISRTFFSRYSPCSEPEHEPLLKFVKTNEGEKPTSTKMSDAQCLVAVGLHAYKSAAAAEKIAGIAKKFLKHTEHKPFNLIELGNLILHQIVIIRHTPDITATDMLKTAKAFLENASNHTDIEKDVYLALSNFYFKENKKLNGNETKTDLYRAGEICALLSVVFKQLKILESSNENKDQLSENYLTKAKHYLDKNTPKDFVAFLLFSLKNNVSPEIIIEAQLLDRYFLLHENDEKALELIGRLLNEFTEESGIPRLLTLYREKLTPVTRSAFSL